VAARAADCRFRDGAEADVGLSTLRVAQVGSFDPTSGLRYIRTSYGEREELLSSIRMIERARAERAFGVG